jgi:hypothetical protein
MRLNNLIDFKAIPHDIESDKAIASKVSIVVRVNPCHQRTSLLKQFFTALVLTSILTLAIGITRPDTAVADSVELSTSVAKKRLNYPSSEVIGLQLSSTDRFLSAVTGLRQDLSGTAKTLMTQLQDQIAKEPARDGSLPDSIAKAVLQDASTRSKLSSQELRIVNAKPQNWPDGCLGLASPGTFCTQIVVVGWQVTVEGGQRSFVYRTNESGSVVKLAAE